MPKSLNARGREEAERLGIELYYGKDGFWHWQEHLPHVLQMTLRVSYTDKYEGYDDLAYQIICMRAVVGDKPAIKPEGQAADVTFD